MKLGLIINSLLYFLILMLMQNQGCNCCLEKERIGLLEIKHYILSQQDYGNPYNNKELGSWVDDRDSNCCSWKRVKCSNISSGHITELSLDRFLDWTVHMLNVSLFRPFEELRLLDLSYNSFQGWIGNEGFQGLKMVETLDLSGNRLNSSILSSLNGLTALTTLNLRYNKIDNNFFAQGFPRLKRLETLDLSGNDISSSILPSLNGLTALTTLKFHSNSMESFSAQGFSRSKELEVLDLSENWLNCNIITSLHGFISLRSLILYGNGFGCSLSTLDFVKFSRLELLDMGGNQLTGSLHVEDVQHLKNLKMLSLSDNQMNGSIEGLCNLMDLVELDISYNMFGAKLPECLSNLTNLRVLDLSYNLFSGNFPSFTTNLTSLAYLSIYGNYMEGSFSLTTLANHSNLQHLYISPEYSGVHIETEKTKWFPKFQLKSLFLGNCNLNKDKGSVIPTFLSYQYNLVFLDLSRNNLVGSFPSWLIDNHNMKYLDISNNNLSGLLPEDIGVLLPNVIYLNFSWNSFEGNIPSSIGTMKKLQRLDFSQNHFSGELPKQLATDCDNLQYLKVSNNFLHGNIPKFVNVVFLFLNNNNFSGTLEDVLGNNTGLSILSISNNSITGKIPSSIYSMQVLLMSGNLLEGEIPDSNLYPYVWKSISQISNMSHLQILDLSQNKLIGSIPDLTSLTSLRFLYLQQNDLSGSKPSELSAGSQLQLLDLRDNKFSGKIPNWMDKLSELRVLLLGGNNFEGEIQIQLCQLKNINIMDLSRNMLNASIPSCFQNMSFGMRQYVDDDGEVDPNFEFSMSQGFTGEFIPNLNSFFNASLSIGHLSNQNSLVEDLEFEVQFRTKHYDYFYHGIVLEIMSGLDLSCNKLTGTIPFQIGDLLQIKALNLSHNHLTGPIPITFSNLTQIESLDLSYNNLSGKIPYELTQLNFLSTFNLSYNNLSGTPPSTGQFADFDEDNYRGNPGLCGPLLNRKCERVSSTPSSQSNDNEEKETMVDMITFYWSFTASYITILLAFITVLCINPRWRMAWFYYISKFMRRFFPTFPLY